MRLCLFGRKNLPVIIAVLFVSVISSFASISPQPLRESREIHDTTIRVRISEGASVVNVRGFDLRIYNSPSGSNGARKLAVATDRQSEWELRCEDGRIRAKRISGEHGIGQASLDLAEPVEIRSPAGFLQFNGKPYHEQLRVFTAGSLCEVVNEVELEKYLEGLVNGEFSSKWSEEAIGAQVVAARTYALFQLRQARNHNDPAEQHYDLDSSTRDQVYGGSIKEDPRAARIVGKTRGWVLTVNTSHGVSPLKAYYHSNCGGMTELPDKVWGTPNQGFRRVVDPYCSHSPMAHWSFDLSGARIMAALRHAGHSDVTDLSLWPKNWKQILQNGKLRGLRIGRSDASGRVEQIFLSFDLNQHVIDWEMTGAKFRTWVGPAEFKSTAFQVLPLQGLLGSAVGSTFQPFWRFSGRGNGHGVGMCQWGAKAMGDKGFKTAAILKFYYPDAQLRKFW